MIIRSGLLALVLLSLSLPAQVNDVGSFMEAFAKAVREDDFASQQELVEKHNDLVQNGFFRWEVDWCAASVREDDEGRNTSNYFQKILEQLATVYKITPPRSDFLVQRFAWLRDLTPEQRKLKIELWKLLAENFSRYEDAQRKRSEKAVRELLPTYVEAAEKAETATDYYWAAQANFIVARLYEMIPDWFEAVYHYMKAVDAGGKGHVAQEVAKQNIDAGVRIAATTGKIRTDFVDITLPLAEAKTKYQERIENPTIGAGGGDGGADVPGTGGEAGIALPPGPRPNVHTARVEWAEAPEFKVSNLRSDPPYNTPSFRANAHWYFWTTVVVKKGETVGVPLLPGPAEIENDSGKLFLHSEGKGKTKSPLRLKLGAKPEVTEFRDVKYLDGSTGRIWHTVLQMPSTFSFNGFRLGIDSEIAALRIKGATVAKGKIGDTEVTLHDLNGNGAFNDFGIDCLVTGKGKDVKVQPLSKYVDIGGLFYELKLDANGRGVRTKPYDGPIAPLRFEYEANMKPEYMVAMGTGDDSTYFFNLTDALEKPIWVIPGVMQFFEGYFISGKGDKAKTMVVTRGRSSSFTIQPGQENVWKMGAGENGFTFSFKVETFKESGQEMIRIPANEIRIQGCFGESYEYSMFGVPTPKVSVRKGSDGPVVLREQLKRPDDAEIRKSIDLMWFPKTPELKKTFQGDFSVKMEDDYRPLGKVESEWIAGG